VGEAAGRGGRLLHSGWGLEVNSQGVAQLTRSRRSTESGPTKYIVDVVMTRLDFILQRGHALSVGAEQSGTHTLNCGYRARLSGETDFPCIYGEKVGLGRIYCKAGWRAGLRPLLRRDPRTARSYVAMARATLIDFAVNGLPVGTKGSQLDLPSAGTVKVTASVAALLNQRARSRAPRPSLLAKTRTGTSEAGRASARATRCPSRWW